MKTINYRSERHRNIAGVCSGIALANGYSISLLRIIALLSLSLGGIGILAYILFWIFIPKASKLFIQEPTMLPDEVLKRSSDDSVLAGVCGGLSNLLNIDSNLIRIFYVLLVLVAGLGLIPYFYAWIILPKEVKLEL